MPSDSSSPPKKSYGPGELGPQAVVGNREVTLEKRKQHEELQARMARMQAVAKTVETPAPKKVAPQGLGGKGLGGKGLMRVILSGDARTSASGGGGSASASGGGGNASASGGGGSASGSGHGGKTKGLGKGGKGLGKGGAKRHRKVLRDSIRGIKKPSIRRMARRGGVKRMSGEVFEETRVVIKGLMEPVIRHAVTFTEHARRKTVTAMDVIEALKNCGIKLYGFGVRRR